MKDEKKKRKVLQQMYVIIDIMIANKYESVNEKFYQRNHDEYEFSSK